MKKLMNYILVAVLMAGVLSPTAPAATPLTADITPVQRQASEQYRGTDWDFALELAKQTLLEQEENPVISPLSAWLALSMAANGAAGDTEKAFSHTLGQTMDALNAANLGRTKSLLAAEGQTALSVANSVWLDDRFSARQDFLQRMVDYYGAQVYGMKLSGQEAMEAMNQWISSETKGMIPTMFSEPLSEETMAVLINTVYMKAKWRSPFDGVTSQGPFTLANGKTVDADLMHQKSVFPYVEKDGVQGIQLPYEDGRLSFFALLPADNQSPAELLSSLDRQTLEGYFKGAENKKVRLTMPRFTVEHTVNMNQALQAMGLDIAFTPGRADFSGMGGAENGSLYMSAVMQKVKVIVDEAGTEAAAATAVIVGATSMPVEEEMINLSLDRPFVYGVMDQVTGSILFAGVLTNPAA